MKISIVLFCALLIIFYLLINDKMHIEKSIIITIIISSIISNLQFNFINSKYDNLYKNVYSCSVIATVVSEPKESKYNIRYKIKVEKIENNDKYNNTYLYLYVKKTSNEVLEFGDEVIFDGIYSESNSYKNYNGYDYNDYLKTFNMYGSIKADSKINVIKKENCSYVLILINRLRKAIIQNVKSMLSSETKGFTTAIILGDTDYINTEVKSNFKNSSLSHVLALSGMHISYLIIGVTLLLDKLKIGKRKTKIFTILFLIFFILLTGFSPSVTRAGIMGILMLFASLCYRKADVYTSISFALLLSLVINPFSINNVGLLLSYGGTIGIVLFEKRIEALLKVKKCQIKDGFINWLTNKLKPMMSVSISAQIIIAPIVILKFNTISLTFLVSNVLVGFFIGAILICGYVLSSVSLILPNIAKCGFAVYDVVIKLFLKIVELCSMLPFSKVYVCTPNIILIIAYYVFVLMLYFKEVFIKKYYKKTIAVILVICLVFDLIKIIPSDLKIYFIDVGQGDSTLIVTPNHKRILIDGGGVEDSDYDIGENVLIPYLLSREVNTLDYVIVSHFDTDHVGGLLTVMQELRVNNVIISKQNDVSENYKRFVEIVNEKKINVVCVQKGDRLQIENDVYIEFLWPNNSNLITENTLNNNSIVCKLNYNNFSMLFTGDIEKLAEEKIVNAYKASNILNSTILKVAHHGSKTSSTKEFLEKVKPKIALIGVGKNNKFGHPNQEVLERLESIRV